MKNPLDALSDEEKRPVAFRAKDALDQRILFDNEDEAASYAADTGVEYQGLYARDDKSPAPSASVEYLQKVLEEEFERASGTLHRPGALHDTILAAMRRVAFSRPAADRGQIEACPFCGGDELNLADNEYRSRLIARSNAMRGQIVERAVKAAEEIMLIDGDRDHMNQSRLTCEATQNIARFLQYVARALSPAPAQTEE